MMAAEDLMSEAMRPFLCRRCNERLTAPASAIGRVATCHVCGEDMLVPRASAGGLPKGDPIGSAPASAPPPRPPAAPARMAAPAMVVPPPLPPAAVSQPPPLPPAAPPPRLPNKPGTARFPMPVIVAGTAAALIAGTLCLGSAGFV